MKRLPSLQEIKSRMESSYNPFGMFVAVIMCVTYLLIVLFAYLDK